MHPRLIHSGPALAAHEIDAFEARHHVVLPADYRAFLARCNGGMPEREVLDCPHRPSVVVWVLYSLNDGTPHALDRTCASLDWEEAYSRGYLCIGRDSGGSGLFISTRGDDCGAIFFFDREETLRPASGAVRIADSFESMMNQLRPL